MESRMLEYGTIQLEDIVRTTIHWIDRRYKILKFICYYNAVALTYVIIKSVTAISGEPISGITVCALSFLVAAMGFATDVSMPLYNLSAFKASLFKRKSGLNDLKGMIKQGGNFELKNYFRPNIPVLREHKFFYFFLMVFWSILAFLTLKNLFIFA